MANLSKIRREKMLGYLEKLKAINNDDEHIRAITEIENALNEKKYGLVWEEHSEKVDEMLEHNIPVFVENVERKIEVNENEAYNFLLEGDNLHSLKLLEKTHKGKIDVIYIDPPYNTGSNEEVFRYNDCIVDSSDLYRHSKWLSFISERIKIARRLLSNNGVLFISIDNNEFAQLKLLCDNIFGENCFVTNIHVELSATQGMKVKAAQKGNLVKNGEYILVYSKDGHKNIAKKILYDFRPEYDSHYSRFLLDDMTMIDLRKAYSKSFPETKLRNVTEMYSEELSFRNFVSENISRIFADDKVTGFEKEDYQIGIVYEVYRNNRRYYIYNNGSKIRQLLPLETSFGVCDDFRKSYGLRKIRGDWWKDFYRDMGNVSKEGNVVFANGKKPIRLIRQILQMATDYNSTILDFFAGSGTTGHAVMQLNKEDGGNRKYILCTNNENNICEDVTYQRLKNIQEELPHNLKYFKTDFIPKFSSDEDNISDKIMEHIRELIELEYAIEVDGRKYIIISDEDKLDKIISDIEDGGKLFVKSGIFLTRNHQRLLEEKDVSIIEIPEYYFREELKEIGEL